VTEPRPHPPIADPEDAPRAPEVGNILAGKYRVEGVVGMGGMGVVVAAQHVTLGQTVAIKLLSLAGLSESRRAEACARFVREGQAAARLTSDHVVRVHDVGTLDDGAPFMVMELLRGDDLSTILSRQGPSPAELAVEYIVQACDAVGEAHGHGIVHRDLKPSNLFVTRRGDGHPVLKVLDFGISKAMTSSDDPLEGSLTATRSVVGSPYYMSPEQVRDAKRVDTRSDIWSLGMILYELLVGEPAFNAGTLPGICAAIAADAPQPVRERRPDVPPALEAVVMRCLDKDAGRRFQTIVELVRALAPFLPQGAAASAGDHTLRRLEESSAKVPVARRFPADQGTIQGASSDSGPRLSQAEPDEPFAVSSSGGSLEPVPVGGTPGAVLGASTLASGKSPVVVRDTTLVSRAGTTVPDDLDDREVHGVASRAPHTERVPGSRRPLILLALGALLAALGVMWLRSTPPAVTPGPLPLLHEPVGPSPPAPHVEPPLQVPGPLADTSSVHSEAPATPAPGPSGRPSAASKGGAKPTVSLGAPRAPHALKASATAATAPPPADIRLER
jgi:serine/threonine protein kinase